MKLTDLEFINLLNNTIKKRKITQREFADEIGIRQENLNKVLCNRADIVPKKILAHMGYARNKDGEIVKIRAKKDTLRFI